jgi:hypothetical protein
MPCERKRNTTNDPRTNLLARTKGNGLIGIEGLVEHDHFTCKVALFTLLIRKKHFGIQIFKTMK